ncbi:ankyrin repeat domain-containing protein [Caloranaerobacter sp. DY30410]|uniref:ankyrin repeat domain-containing protein n=1 Tax=Caloranaerobacter sp. DY30410 TaxID=3238305 RepID=UPI003D040ECE
MKKIVNIKLICLKVKIVEKCRGKFILNEDGFTPLYIAVSWGYVDIVDYLISKNVNIDPKTNSLRHLFCFSLKSNLSSICFYNP